MLTRRDWLLLGLLGGGSSSSLLRAAEHLPQSVTFKGVEKFQQVVARAMAENWAALPMGARVAQFGLALRGTPYVGWTLEIDDRVESPSVNFLGLDCWTFFEVSLGLARMIGRRKSAYGPSDLLREIEETRYRGGVCRGNYLDRIHYLDEWFTDNAARGNIRYVTREVGPVVRLTGRANDEMSLNPKLYRYLRASPALVPQLRQLEARLEKVPFDFIPKDQVAACEGKIQSGYIIGIVTNRAHVYCSHVGLALRTGDGACRFMHASATYKKVVVDKTIHEYLYSVKSHAGIVVGRPR
ncbi:N-acetylmuramoyl-L-alanine amidase-like domain-containing protein [Prosthecobacter sp.]|uniref:N-acetylmuramoyl-L-alanine amidase-like domain-containing protein n=1 Tax=Prosthecobacter sp. TaxID=1965333 RepID=UPI0037830212